MIPVPVDDLLERILRYAPNCPDPLAFKCIVEACRRACDKGLMWRETDEIAIDDPGGSGLCSFGFAEIVQIEHADIDGCELEPVPLRWLDENHPRWDRDTTVSGPARYITQQEANTVAVYPRQTGTLTARFVLKPARDAEVLPAFLVSRYYEELGKGAAGLVLEVPDMKVYKPDIGPTLRAEFEAWLAGLNIKEAKGQQNAPLRTKARFF